MRKALVLKFKDGKYSLIYVMGNYSEVVSWSDALYRLFGGTWSYDLETKTLTVGFRFGNIVVEKYYDFEYDPNDFVWMAYDVKFNKQITKLFVRLQEDYVEFVREQRELEFEREILCIEY